MIMADQDPGRPPPENGGSEHLHSLLIASRLMPVFADFRAGRGSNVSEYNELKVSIDEAWRKSGDAVLADRTEEIENTLALLDSGKIRVAEKRGGKWEVNAWVQKAILLYFKIREIEPSEAGLLRFNDKIPVKTDLVSQGIRVVPPGTARYGSFLEPGCVLMPGYVNIGAYIGSGTMIDTWATVGTGAQIGRNVHVAGGVGIGGVLEPVQSTPVIIEDGAFIGSGVTIVSGIRIGKGARIGAGSVVISNVEENQTVFGNPAKPIE